MRCITSGEAFAIQYHREITGAVEILIDDAFNMAMQKPDVKRTICESSINRKKAAWLDFAAFMKQRFPKIKHLDRITISHSEAYYGFLQKEGNFIKTSIRKRLGRIIQYPKDKQLRPPIRRSWLRLRLGKAWYSGRRHLLNGLLAGVRLVIVGVDPPEKGLSHISLTSPVLRLCSARNTHTIHTFWHFVQWKPAESGKISMVLSII